MQIFEIRPSRNGTEKWQKLFPLSLPWSFVQIYNTYIKFFQEFKLAANEQSKVQNETNAKLKLEVEKTSSSLQETQSRLEKSISTQEKLDISLQEKETELVELSDYFESKKLELCRLKDDLETQSDKRQRMESLFQDVSEREMRIQKDLHNFLAEREELKVGACWNNPLLFPRTYIYCK